MASISRHGTSSGQVPGVSLQNVIGSQVVVGDGSFQISILVGGASRLDPVAGGPALQAATLPVLGGADRPDPIGRDEIIAQAAADLAADRCVQLYGEPGVGRTAVAQAIARRLGAQGLRGVHLFGGGEQWTLRLLYERLAKAFFSVPWDNPDETALRAAVGTASVRGVVIVSDCDLDPAELTRLLDTFPGCVFLLTSRQRTLPGGSAAHYEVDPLTLGQARELLTLQLGADPAGRQNVQFDEAYRLSGGRPQHLLQHAAFIGRAAVRPGQTERIAVPFPEQIALLVAGLTEPARRVLVALADFGVEIDAGLLPAVTGLGGAQDAVGELSAAHLIRREGSACRIDPDTIPAVAGQKADVKIAADGLLPLLTGGARAPGTELPTPATHAALPGPRLLLAVAQGLHAAGQPAYTTRFARAAVPVAVAAGDMFAWKRLVALGVQAATEARSKPDLAYFLNEQHTGHLANGDTVAAAAVFFLLAEALKGASFAPVAPAIPQLRRPRGRRLLHQGRRALAAGHGAAAAGAVAVVVVVVVVVMVTLTSVKPAAKGAAAVAEQSSAPALTAWTVALRDAPSTPLTGAAQLYTITGQYPVITAGVPSKAEQNTFDQLLQQPVVGFASKVAQQAVNWNQNLSVNGGSSISPGQSAGETTKVTEAGLILTVEYQFNAADELGGGGGAMLVVRMDTGKALAQTAILTPAALETQAGLTQVVDAINARLPAGFGADGCPILTADQFTASFNDQSNSSDIGLNIGVQPAGIDFLIGAGGQNCVIGDVVVPYSALTGLVSPQVLALVQENTAATTAPATTAAGRP